MEEQEGILFELFVQESLELLEETEYLLTSLEQKYDDEVIQDIFRMIHSIKGISLSMGYDKLASFVHDIENFILKLKNNEINSNVETIGILYDSVKLIRQTISDITENTDYEFNKCKIYEKLRKYIEVSNERKEGKCLNKFYITEYELLQMDDAAKKGENVYVIKVEINDSVVMKAMKVFLIVNNLSKIGHVLRIHPYNYENMNDDELGDSFKLVIITIETEEKVKKVIEMATDIKNIILEKFKGKQSFSEQDNSLFEVQIKKGLKSNDIFRRQRRNTIRVDISKLDDFYKKLNELIIDKSLLMRLATNVSQKYPSDNDIKDIQLATDNLDLLSKDLENLFVDIRVYTMTNIVGRLEKLINSLAIRSGKKINLHVEGERLKVDRRILEIIVDSLVHIMRNCVDHGIESIDERVSKGKTPDGNITLKVIHNKNFVIFEVSDDGRGICIDNIKREAIKKGICSVEKIEKMSDEEIINLIFSSGFSTASVITEISGRGIGMDVVKNNIEELKGIIDIESEKDKGTKMIIKVPLTLLSLSSLIFKANNNYFAIPETSVINTICIDRKEYENNIVVENNTRFYNYNRFKVQEVDINELFKLEKSEEKDNNINIVIVGIKEKRFCLAVNGTVFNSQLVIKNLDENIEKEVLFKDNNKINGISLLDNGEYVYILDVNLLANLL